MVVSCCGEVGSGVSLVAGWVKRSLTRVTERGGEYTEALRNGRNNNWNL
jgi:hypothetical protein